MFNLFYPNSYHMGCARSQLLWKRKYFEVAIKNPNKVQNTTSCVLFLNAMETSHHLKTLLSLPQVSEGDNLGQCPACGFAFCTRCETTYHGPTDCKQDQDDNPGNQEKSENLSQNGRDLAELEKIMMKHGTLAARKVI